MSIKEQQQKAQAMAAQRRLIRKQLSVYHQQQTSWLKGK